ncbi:MAG TPA: hypothetical protein VNB64_02155 [Solirubrobacteraceae bacterium]|nr:hypothetical protein [Solirubrobacteraceae bacterium]
MPRRALSTAVAALALAAPGCGDDGNDETRPATQTTVSPAEARAYKAQVQTILTTVGTAGRSLVSSVRGASSLDDVARALEAFKGSVEQAATRLDAGRPPPAAREGQRDLSATLREIATGTEPTIGAARRGDRAAFRREFVAYQGKLSGVYRQRLRAAGDKIDRALAAP